MFTGLIEGVGIIKSVNHKSDMSQLEVVCDFDLGKTNVGDSLSINGCCLTIVSRLGNTIWADVSPETIERTAIGKLKSGDPVNLERAMIAGERLNGHIVQGHVDGVGKITEIKKQGDATLVMVEISSELARYIVEKGSIAVDGVSLTVNSCNDSSFSVMVIPHTKLRTTFARLYIGKEVNLEVDIIGKYVEKLTFLNSSDMKKQSPITEEFLRQHGFEEEEK